MRLHTAYIAGMLDADGHVTFTTGRLCIGVTNANVELMEALKETIGGGYSKHQRQCEPGCRRHHVHVWTEYYGWTAGGERAAIVLRALLPLLVVKRERAAAALLEWQRSTETMERPSRRTLHMRRAREEMRARGWLDPNAPELPRERCRHGHLLAGPNLYVRPRDGRRECRTCGRDRKRRAA